MRPTNILSVAVIYAAASTAWPSGWQPLEFAKRELAPLLPRQDDDNTSAQSTAKTTAAESATQGSSATADASSTKETGKTTAQSSGDDATTTAKSTGKTTGGSSGESTGTATSDGDSSKKSTYQTTKTYDARLPPGGVQMITPNAMTGSQYYKIKDYVTFAWNFTSLSQTPSAIDILASCSLNSQTYTIATNQSITASTQAVTWDTGGYQATATVPLLTETYTLIIHDAAKDVSATAMAGYLGTWNQFTFGMYTPEPYTPYADWTCATCSGAMSQMERHTWGFLFGMVAVTILSFGWFGGVAGLW